MATSRIVEHVGRVLGDRYRLTRPLGTGASAHVYVAEDVTLRRRVAVKLLHPALADDEAFLRRFQAEARVVAALRHPNIVRVYDWGDDGGSPFLVMELLEGGSLRGLLDRGQLLTPAQAARVGAEAAQALDYAHGRGLVHRDVKPANLLFDENGHVSVSDFGLARALAEATWTEPVGAVLGTARYAAPEQIGGGRLDGKADVYALALVLVEAVTGRVPFAADTTIGTLMARVDRDLPVSEDLGPLVPAVAAAGVSDPVRRSDAATLAVGLAAAARRLPAPGPLILASAQAEPDIEDDPDKTELPGAIRLFDADRIEHRPPVGPPAASRSASRLRDTGPRAPIVPVAPPRARRPRRWPMVLVLLLILAALTAGAVEWLQLTKPEELVPSVVHDTTAVAAQTLAPLHLHLVVDQRVYDDNWQNGLIISQKQRVGQKVRQGSRIDVVVSLGPTPVPVPNLSGLSEQDATNQLEGAGLKVGAISRPYNNARKGTVLSWTGEGQQLPRGSTVDLVVSNGPPVVTVPSVAQDSVAAAEASLRGQQLGVVENDVFNNTVPKGVVVGTTPAAGTTVTIGTTVTVFVSKGPDLVQIPPTVVGESVTAATNALQAIGLNVTGVTGNPTANVARTSPAAGTMVLRGSSVTLIT